MNEAPQLADITWTWRRVFAFTVILLTAVLLALIIRSVRDVGALQAFGLGLLLIQALVIIAYMMGATATDLQRLMLARHTTTTVQRTETGA